MKKFYCALVPCLLVLGIINSRPSYALDISLSDPGDIFPADVMDVVRLDDTHIVLVLDRMQTYANRINDITRGQYLEDARAWWDTRSTDSPAWAARARADNSWNRYISNVRSDEYALRFSIDGRSPASTYILPQSMGGEWFAGDHEPHFLVYAFLELRVEPTTNLIQVKIGDEPALPRILSPRSHLIKINQVGYRTEDSKRVYVGGYQYGDGPITVTATTFKVINSLGASVFTGALQLRSQNQKFTGTQTLIAADTVYEGDFSAFTIPGTYRIMIDGVGESWPFTIGPGVYDDVMRVQMTGLLHQRAGMAMTFPWSMWQRPRQVPFARVYQNGHIPFTDTVKEPTNYDRFDVVAATTNLSSYITGFSGGWHDAGDYDLAASHFRTVLALLLAYEWFPEKFHDGQFAMPESNNGVPDILDEASWGLLAWRKGQLPNGGIRAAVEARTHTPWNSTEPYGYGIATRWCSLIYAASAAKLSRLLAPFDGEESAVWLSTAQKAYNFGINDDNRLSGHRIKAIRDRGEGNSYSIIYTEPFDATWPYLLPAQAELGITLDRKKLDDLPTPGGSSGVKEVTYLLYTSILSKLGPGDRAFYLDKWYLKRFNEMLTWKMPYGQPWKPDWIGGWGWGQSQPSNFAGLAVIIEHLTGDPVWLDPIVRGMDYDLGCNPHNLSLWTGLGAQYPTILQHRVYAPNGDPQPGTRVYGHNGTIPYWVPGLIWQGRTHNIPFEHRLVFDYGDATSVSEFTVADTQALPILATARLMDGNFVSPLPVQPRPVLPSRAIIP